MFGEYPDEMSHLYSRCESCTQPVCTSSKHTCAAVLPGQSWWSMNRIRHPDTVFFSHRLSGRIHVDAITVWHSSFVNGFSMLLRDVRTGVTFHTMEKWGNHTYPQATTVNFEPAEFIVKAGIRAGDIVDHLWIETSRGHHYSFGGPGGSAVPVEWPEDSVVIGVFGGFGGHIHNLGFYLDKGGNVAFERRRVYFLVRHKAESTPVLLGSVEGLLKTLTPDTFRDVVLYL